MGNNMINLSSAQLLYCSLVKARDLIEENAIFVYMCCMDQKELGQSLAFDSTVQFKVFRYRKSEDLDKAKL